MIESDFNKIVWCLNKNDYYYFLKNIREIFLENSFDIWLDRDVDVLVKEVLDLLEEAELRPCVADNFCANDYLVLYWETERDWFGSQDDEIAALHRYITEVHKGYCDYTGITSIGEAHYYREDIGFIHPYVSFAGMGEKEKEAR